MKSHGKINDGFQTDLFTARDVGIDGNQYEKEYSQKNEKYLLKLYRFAFKFDLFLVMVGLFCAVLASPSIVGFLILLGEVFNAYVSLDQTRNLQEEDPGCFGQDDSWLGLESCEEIVKRKGFLPVVEYWTVVYSFALYGMVIILVQVNFYHFASY